MPHINKIRLVNVNFNDAKGIYDDFMMRLDGKSTTYDLMNTGGKSLLLLMLLQTVIPNTYLKKEKPIKNIFVGGNTKRTSHCLVEWILDEGYEYKYMMTGFCARKKQDIDGEIEENKLEIDYYNYCYFYNHENEYDIKHIKLAEKQGDEKVFMSYDKLRQLLSNMKKEGLPVEVFDSKKDYMKHIEYYGLNAAEWKLISEINVSENYIEKYFKENKTSRKLIENFLIKIIDNVNMQNSADDEKNENQLADILIELKDNLMKFRKQSDNKNEFLQAKELYSNLKQKNNRLLSEFSETEKLNQKAYESYTFKTNEKERLSAKIQNEKNEIERLKEANINLERKNDKLEIDKIYCEIEEVGKEKSVLQEEREKMIDKREQKKKQVELAKSQNEYIEYIQNQSQAEQVQIRIENLSLSESDIEKEYQTYGYNYKVQLADKIDELQKDFVNQTNLKQEKQEAKEIAKKEENEARDNLSKCKSRIEDLTQQIQEKQDEIDGITQEFIEQGNMELLLNLDESMQQEKMELENIKQQKEDDTKRIENIKQGIIQTEKDIIQIKADKSRLSDKQEDVQNQIKVYEGKKKSIESLVKTFQAENIEKLIEKLEEEIQNQEKQRNTKQIEKQIKQRKLEVIEKYHMMIPNEDIFHLKEKLEKSCNYVTTGVEKLMEIAENKRSEILNRNPLFIYSVFVDDESFQKMKKKQLEIEVENLVPIASIEILRGEYEYQQENIIFPIQKSVYQNLDADKLEEHKLKLTNTVQALEHEIESMQLKINEIRNYLEETIEYTKMYSEEAVKLIYAEKQNIEKKMEEAEENLKRCYQLIENRKEEIEHLERVIEKIIGKQKELEDEIKELEELQKIQKEQKILKDKKEMQEKDCKALKEILEEKIEIYENIEDSLEKIKNIISSIEKTKGEYQNIYENMMNFKQMNLLEQSFEEIKNHFKVLDSKMSHSHTELNDLQERYKMHIQIMKKCEENIEQNHYTLKYFLNQNVHFEKVLDSTLKELISEHQKLEKQTEATIGRFREKESEYNDKKVRANVFIEKLQEKGVVYEENERVKELYVIEKTIKENDMQLKINKKEISNLTEKIETVDKQLRTLDSECNLLEHFITEKEIKPFEVDISNLLSNEVYSYQKIHDESIKADKAAERMQVEFNNYIRYMKESIEDFYIKQDIIDTMQELKVPSKLEECTVVENGIATIIEQLEEKIRHIEEALKSLEGYQENFITNCFEKAETIVRDLEKLPGLSKIKIGGKDVNIIKLDLFEYEKEEKLKKMKEYIYRIVKEMEDNPEEMSKEQLNERLSSKALVSQIVNMDKASVKLYKIEDIQEHSTYKRWEDDLGSDGQVNAIYFMFAVCIISYISMLTRKEGSSKSRKVIIVDNPFGATSAVFLWNVMFSILKENNVQLIAPGHNINKEIISKFEVNYVLKHEYYNGNKKSVVVDKELRTEDDMDSMNFAIIEGDQQSIF